MISLKRPNSYSGVPLDRMAALRKDPAALAAARASTGARVVPVWRTQSLVSASLDAPRGILCPIVGEWPEPLIFLGMSGNGAVFAADISILDDPFSHPAIAGDDARFVDLRPVGPLMEGEDAALLAFARALVWWSARNRFCGVCGAEVAPVEGGFVRQCVSPACGAQHFPRTDPAVIMLVHDDHGHVVMARQRGWTSRVHSVLAGFVEPGETLEEAVAREVMEEVGIEVADIRYFSSQPWPFPASLMLGFFARAVTTELRVDADELETAFWMHKSRLINVSPDDPVQLPQRDSLARRLLAEWLRVSID